MSHSSGTVVYTCSDKLPLLYALFLHSLFILFFLLSFSHHSLTHSLHSFLSPLLILFLASLTHSFTTFLPLSFTDSLPLLTHPTPSISPCTHSQSFSLLPSIVRLSAVPADQLKDAVDSLAQIIASLKEQVKKICPHLLIITFLLLLLFLLIFLFLFFLPPPQLLFSLLSCPPLLSYSHPSPPLFPLSTSLFPPPPPPSFSSSSSIRFISLFHLPPACSPTTDQYRPGGSVFQS